MEELETFLTLLRSPQAPKSMLPELEMSYLASTTYFLGNRLLVVKVEVHHRCCMKNKILLLMT